MKMRIRGEERATAKMIGFRFVDLGFGCQTHETVNNFINFEEACVHV